MPISHLRHLSVRGRKQEITWWYGKIIKVEIDAVILFVDIVCTLVSALDQHFRERPAKTAQRPKKILDQNHMELESSDFDEEWWSLQNLSFE